MTDDVLEVAQLDESPRAGEELAQPVDLGSRMASWRTIASFAIALAILAVALKKSGVTPGDLRTALTQVNPWLFGLAFVIYYTSFPLRTLRWRMLMRNANTGDELALLNRARFRDLLEILYLSWFANCVVPAKLGDVYRAYLTRTSVGISAPRTVGTILAERVLDLLVLFPLLLLAAVLTFRDQLFADSTMRTVVFGAMALGIIAALAVLAIWQLGDGVRSRLPQRIHAIFTAFQEGAVRSFRRDLGALFGLTVLVWFCEGGRLYMVLWALGLMGHGKIGPSAAWFLALGSSVITTLPAAPGGLGFVEAFLIASFKALKHGTTGGTAAAVALLDRIISYLSLVVIGFIVYICSSKTREALRAPAPRNEPPAPGRPLQGEPSQVLGTLQSGAGSRR